MAYLKLAIEIHGIENGGDEIKLCERIENLVRPILEEKEKGWSFYFDIIEHSSGIVCHDVGVHDDDNGL